MSSAKPTKLITSPTSAGSSFDTLQSSQLNFNHHLIFHSTYICCNFFSIYSYFSILSYIHNSLLIFCSSIYILPSSRTSSSIKSTTCTSRFFFKCCATRYWRSVNIIPCRTCGMQVNTSEFAGKDNSEIVSCRYSFLTFLYNFEFLLGLLYFLREVFHIMYKEDSLYGYYKLRFNFLGKSFQWLWYHCFSHLYYTCLLGFRVAQTNDHLNVRTP